LGVLWIWGLAVSSMELGPENSKEEFIPEPETRPTRLRWVDLPAARFRG
jgi:hypothetical protein